MAYVDTDDVKQLIPSNYNTSRLTTAILTAYAAEAEGRVDAYLASRWSKFNSHDNADHPTPALIKESTRRIAAGLAILDLASAYSSNRDLGENMIAEGEASLSVLMSSNAQLPTNSTAGESISFPATDGESWERSTTMAVLASTSPLESGDPPRIIIQTVRIASATGLTNPTYLRNGIDFRVFWRPEWNQWILESHQTELQEASSVTVNYQWDYRRMVGTSPYFSGKVLEA